MYNQNNFLKRAYKKIMKEVHPKFLFLKLFSKRNFVRKKIHGNEMILDLRDKGLSRDLIIYGSREKWASKIFESELKKDMNLLEVGANKGYFLLIGARKIFPGKVYALEPDPRNMSVLKKNISLNGLNEKIILFDCAAGNQNKNSEFFLSKHHNASNLNERDPSFSGRKIIIKERKLDDLLRNKKIDYVRMDLEGYEFEVLKGMEEKLKKVEGMFLEVHPFLLKKRGIEIEVFYSWLFERGFYIKAIDGKKGLHLKKPPKICQSTNHVFFEREKNV